MFQDILSYQGFLQIKTTQILQIIPPQIQSEKNDTQIHT